MASILEAPGGCVIPKAHERGYHIVYRAEETNRCPGCGHSHWYVGRAMAECAFCATALPLDNAEVGFAGLTIRHVRRPVFGPEEHAVAA
jgi:hypothetical protein